MTLLRTLRAARSIVLFWETPDRSIPVKLVTQDNRIWRGQMEVRKGCCQSPQDGTYEAWQIDSSNLTNDPELGHCMVLHENTCIPPALFHENPAHWQENEINKLWSETYEEGKTISINKNNRDMALYIMVGIGAMIVIATLLYVSLDLVQKGNISQAWNSAFGAKTPISTPLIPKPTPGVK